MDVYKISQVSRELNLSTRTLRYYEQIGLIESCRVEEYSYRAYTAQTVQRLREIVLLKTLQLSLGDIREILESKKAVVALGVFREKMREVEGDMANLEVLREVLQELTALLERTFPAKKLVFTEDTLPPLLSSLQKRQKARGGITVEKLQRANEAMQGQISPRIVTIAPCVVASVRTRGANPENEAEQLINEFTLESGLLETKPDLRLFGFNSPSPSLQGQPYGYEFWVTINGDTNVPAPLVKKEFPGGLYAAHAISFGEFYQWEYLSRWVADSAHYEGRQDRDMLKRMGGLMEEWINYTQYLQKGACDKERVQLDLLFPVREK